MKWHRTWLWLMLFLSVADAAPAQQPGTVVQLPTFSAFSVGTTVSVPDRGSVFLGGIGRASSGRSESGVPLLPLRPFRNSSISAARSASGAQVTVTIHDFDALDPYLRSQPGGSQSLQVPQPRAAAAANIAPRGNAPAGPSWRLALPAGAGSSPPASAAVGAAEIRAQRAAQQAVRQDEAIGLLERGRRAEANGKPNVARIYYQMAADRASGELKQQVLMKLEAVRGSTADWVARP